MHHPLLRSLAGLLTLALGATAAQSQSIATGARHGLALQADGSVLAWGDNRQAQLGGGKTVHASTAREIPLPAKAAAVRTSNTGVLALDEQGNVWSWGTNRKGQLGDGTRTDRPTPQVIFRGASGIVNGGDKGPSFLIDRDGQPWWWGPLPSGANVAVPERAARVPARLVQIEHQARSTAAIDDQGVVWSWGEGAACAGTAAYTGPVAMKGLPRIQELRLAASAPARGSSDERAGEVPASRIIARDANGALWKWGTDPRVSSWGPIPPPRQTYCPPVAMQEDPWAYERRVHPGMAAQGVKIARYAGVGGAGYLGWTAEGDLWQWMPPVETEPADYRVTLHRVATGVVDASSHTSEGEPLVSGILYITRDGRLHGLGTNLSLHLATASDGVDSMSTPGTVALPGPARSVHAQPFGSYALLSDGRVYGWGLGATRYDPQANFEQRLYPQVPTHIPLGAPIAKLAVAQDQWLALDADGRVWSSDGWGSRPTVREPLKSYLPAMLIRDTGLPLARDIAVSGKTIGMVLGVDGSVWTMGTRAGLAPVGPLAPIVPGVVPDIYGVLDVLATPHQVQGLPPSIVQVASATPVSAALYALDAEGRVWFWGSRSRFGLTGHDSDQLSAIDREVQTPIALPLPQKAVAIRAGQSSFCAILEDGSAQCYGWLFNQHRGVRFRLHAPIREISFGTHASNGTQGTTVHLQLADGSVWAQGQGLHGQLGNGTYANAAEPMPVVNGAATADLILGPSVAPGAAVRPPFRVKMRLTGNLRSLSLGGDVFGSAGAPAASNVYALASAGTPGEGTWVQLDAQGHWGPLRWPIPAIASGAALASAAQSITLENILQRFTGTGLEGLRLYVGHGRDVDEMLAAKRFREVLELVHEDCTLTPCGPTLLGGQ